MIRRGAAERADMHTGFVPSRAAERAASGLAPRLQRAVWSAARLLPALLPVLLFVPFVLAPPVNHDVAAVLSFSQRWLAGEHLYSDLIDVNPPLIFVLNLIPAAIAAATGLDTVMALQLCLIAFGLFAWWLALGVRDRAAEGPAESAFLDVLPGLFVFAAGYDFGQREYLMAVAALPYLLAAVRRERGERLPLRVTAAIVAAIGFALKPHFLGIPALVELYVLLGRARRGEQLRATLRDPVPWAMAAVWAAYLLSLPLFFSDYLNVVVPLAWGYYLENGENTVWLVPLVRRMLTVLCLLAPLAGVALWPGLRAGYGLPRVLCVAALGAVASAVAQHKGWSYHILPIELFTCGLGGVLAARWLDGLGAARSHTAAIRIAAALGGLFALYSVTVGEAPWNELGFGTSDASELTALLQDQADGERVLALSPGIAPIFPALNYARARLTLRTMNLWLLDGAYRTCLPNGHRYREVWEMGRPEFFVYHTVAEDFARNPPAAVVVDHRSGIPACAEPFDIITYFSRHPLFAEVWSHYRLSGRAGGFSVYTRKD
jgi:hypothetical protein